MHDRVMRTLLALLPCLAVAADGPIDLANRTLTEPEWERPSWALRGESSNETAAVGESEVIDQPHQFWFGKRVVVDLWGIVSSPVRWDRYDWGVAGLCVAGTVGTGLFVDRYFQSESQESRNDDKDRWSGTWGQLGTIYSVGVLGAAGIAGWAGDDPRGVHILVDGLEASLIASGIITPAIKLAAGRARPNQTAQDADSFDPFSGQASFPSGHTTQAFTVAAVVANTMRDDPWIGGLAFAVAGGVGLSRVNDNAHYMSDVVAGAIIGTYVGYEVVKANRERRGDESSRGMRIQPLLGADANGVELSWRW